MGNTVDTPTGCKQNGCRPYPMYTGISTLTLSPYLRSTILRIPPSIFFSFFFSLFVRTHCGFAMAAQSEKGRDGKEGRGECD